MRCRWKCLLVCLWLAPEFAFAGGVGLQAHWLWSSRYPRAGETIRLRCEFNVTDPAQHAELRGLADDRATVFLNGRNVAEFKSARRFTTAKVPSLKTGKHLLEIEATNQAGAAGVWLQLDWTDSDSQPQRLVTDGDWEVRDANGAWRRAVSLGLLGIAPWWRPAGELDDYDQWKRAIGTGQADEAARIRVMPGFQAELVRSSQKGEGSWVSLTFDAKGRLIVGREGSGILRMTLPQTDASDEIKVELINDKLQECRGLLWAFDSLFANANNSKGLYRLRDTDGDDQFDDVKLLKATGGGVGHGRNALTLGPDNLIYVIHGNNVLISETDRTIPDDSPLRHLAEDRLRPAFWDRFMFDSDAKVPAGYVARTNADGSVWQVVAGGFRNPYGVDFNADGELFTFDADNEGDQGTPWYRPTRINHIVSGGDYGFRQGSGNRPGHYAENLPSILNMGLASPTGVKSGHRGKFPSPYREAMFVCDWSYGRIHAIHLDPDGASYRCRSEVFLEGQPLNVTDVTFGPDGAMYFVTGGRGTQSGLYRVKARPELQASPDERTILLEESARFHKTLRRRLEWWHSVVDPTRVDNLLSQLGDDDDWVRHAARVALERQPLEVWQDRVLAPQYNDSIGARVTGLLALVRAAEGSSQKAELQRRVCNRVIALPWIQLLWVEDRMDAWRVLAVAFARLGRPSEDVAQRVTDVLAPQYPQELEEPNQRLCELLAYLEWPPLIEKTMPRLEVAVEQEDKLTYLATLRNVPVGWTLDLRRRYFTELRKADLFDGGNLLPSAINGIREDAVAMLSAEERRELGLLVEPAADSGGDIAVVTAARPVVREWKFEDLEAKLKDAAAPRDVTRGERLFRDVQCIRCHRFGTEGRTLGPDLTFVASRFGPRDLLEHMLVPSKVIDGKYRQTTVETKSGKVLVGQVVGGDGQNLLLAPDPLRPTKVTKVALNEIETRQASPVSPMPVGLLNSLTEAEILDLLEYLRVGRR